MKTKRLRILSKVSLAVFIILCICLFLAPRIAKHYIIRNSKELIGRKIDIDKIQLNYFSGALRVKNFVFYEQDSINTFLSFTRLYINVDYIPFLKKEVYIQNIELDGLYLQVLQNKDSLNINDLIPPEDSLSGNEAIEDSLANDPLKLTINNIRINNAYLSYTDLALDHTISLDTLDLTIPGFTWSKSSTELALDFRFVDGGKLFTQLTHEQSDSSYAVQLKIDSLNLSVFEPYIKQSIHIDEFNGYYSNDLSIRGSLNHLTDFSVSGSLSLYKIQLIDTLNREVLSFDELNIELDTLNLSKNEYVIDHIHLWDPQIYFELIDTSNNWLVMIKMEDSSKDSIAQDSSAEENSELNIVLNELALVGGTIQFSDKTLKYPFNYLINNIEFESVDIGLENVINMKISAGLNEIGTIKSTLKINSQNLNEIDINLAIQQFRMKDIEPYLRHYFGYPVNEGIMNFTSTNKLSEKSINSSNNIYFRKFKLGVQDKKSAEIKIPLKLALGILSDADGIIDLDVPLEVKDDEARIENLGKLIFRALGNVFVKAATSPYNLLADLYDVNPEKLQQIILEMHEVFPSGEGMETLDMISAILNDKPGLYVEFYYAMDSARVKDSLSYLLARNHYFNEQNISSESDQELHDTLLLHFLNKHQNDIQNISDSTSIYTFCKNFLGEDVLRTKMDSIISGQTEFIKEYLIVDKSIANERFAIIQQAPDSISPDKDLVLFHVFFNAMEDEASQSQ